MKKYICRECKSEVKESEWIEDEMFCEDCGDHLIYICPYCSYIYDLVFDSIEKLEVGYVD